MDVGKKRGTKKKVFAKRTFAFLTPLFLTSTIVQAVSFQAKHSTSAPLLTNFGLNIAPNSAKRLAEILKPHYPKGIEDYGALLIKKSSEKDLIIEQSRPFFGTSQWDEFSFKKVETSKSGELIQKSNDLNDQGSSQKYTISQSDFLNQEFKSKGDLNLITVFNLSIKGGDSVPITHVIPFSDLISSQSKSYKVVSISEGDKKISFDLELKKNGSKNEISIEVKKDTIDDLQLVSSRRRPVSRLPGADMAKLAIKSFYVLFSESPALNPYFYFSADVENQTYVNNDPYFESRIKKFFLDSWKNNKASGSVNTKYTFSTDNNFWKSICRDPFKVGGFIDQELKEDSKPHVAASSQSSSDSKIKKQLKAFEEFRVGLNQKPKPTKQYYWDQVQDKEYVPHTDYTTESPCFDLDDETKQTFKEFAGLNGGSDGKKILENEPLGQSEIKKELIPEVLKKYLNGNVGHQNGESYPKHKIVQSAFRAWGNDYKNFQGDNKNVKELGSYSEIFEKAMQGLHSFSLTINKSDWEKALVEHEKLKKTSERSGDGRKKLNQLKDISSQMQVFYPISFTLYDPISNYLKKQTLFLKTELDLRFLYKKSSFVRKVFSYDIGSLNSNIGLDYQGYSPNGGNKKPFGLSGTLEIYAGMELDVEKNLKISLTAKVSGFVNTKNSTCDWRHRWYKWKNGTNPTETDCSGSFVSSSSSGEWKYRKHNHIPSFLILSLEGEPEVSSFYIDRRIGEDFSTPTTRPKRSAKKEEDGEVETLEGFKSGIENKKIITSLDTDAGNDGEIYFEKLAAYDVTTHEKENKIEASLIDKGWISDSNYQQIYYYRPRKQSNYIEIDDANLKEIKLYISGARAIFSQFFKSHHYGTIMTVCTNKKYSPEESGQKECGYDKKYETIEEDKTESELLSSESINPSIQEITFNYNDIKVATSEDSAKEFHFRRLLHWEKNMKDDSSEYSNKFSTLKDKLKELFKDDATDPTVDKRKSIPEVSMLSIWYSIALWVENKDGKVKLHYITKLRPISMTKTVIDNLTSEQVTGAAGSSGFNIKRFEFTYGK